MAMDEMAKMFCDVGNPRTTVCVYDGGQSEVRCIRRQLRSSWIGGIGFRDIKSIVRVEDLVDEDGGTGDDG